MVRTRTGLPSRRKLVIVSGAEPASYPLPAEGEVVIGRALGCTIRIDDPKASRRHAMLRMGAEVTVTDLGSANGTGIGNRLLGANESAVVMPGDVLAFGATMAIIQTGSMSTRLRRVLTHAHFEARLEDECSRASGKSQFAVVRVRLSPQKNEPIESTFEHWLHPMDVAATYAPQQSEFLLVEVTAEQVQARVEHARALIESVAGPVEIGVALYPAHGRSPQKLIAASGQFRTTTSPSEARVQSGFLEKIRPLIERVAWGTISVLIGGETGAGKEVLAQAIHQASQRSHKPMVCLNCAALSESLLESELFGYERGAFTGATQSKPGLLESADGGTVFLDEIGEMPASLQAKLLRVIQERQVQRIGSLKPRTIDVRFVSATNRDLETEILRGTFRQDLYYRLNGVVFTVPPLRERLDEIELLARAFIAQSAAQLGVGEPQLSADVLALLRAHSWPGNIRELRNVMERAVLLCNGDVMTLEHVPQDRMQRHTPSETMQERRSLLSVDLPTPRATLTEDSPLAHPPFVAEQAERARIVSALESCAGNQTQAAKVLGISRNTLIARLKQYELLRPRKRGA
jgi:transcriptional regulator with GAF, ATPase, and Fis domain